MRVVLFGELNKSVPPFPTSRSESDSSESGQGKREGRHRLPRALPLAHYLANGSAFHK